VSTSLAGSSLLLGVSLGVSFEISARVSLLYTFSLSLPTESLPVESLSFIDLLSLKVSFSLNGSTSSLGILDVSSFFRSGSFEFESFSLVSFLESLNL